MLLADKHDRLSPLRQASRSASNVADIQRRCPLCPSSCMMTGKQRGLSADLLFRVLRGQAVSRLSARLTCRPGD